MREVVGSSRGVGVGLWAWGLIASPALQLALWGFRVVRGERGGFPVAMLVLSGALLVLGVVLLGVERGATLVLTDEALLLERRWRPLEIRRDAIRAVDGDVPGRPAWSETVVVTLDDRTVRLGGFVERPRELVPRLQVWAGLGDAPEGERPPAPRR